MSAPRWNNKGSGNFSTHSLPSDFSSHETILSRSASQIKLDTTPIQNQVEGMVSGFVDQATDWKSLAAMTAGGLAYRWGKIGVMSSSLGTRLGHVAAMSLRGFAIAFGLGSEVTAFEFTHRTLESIYPSPVTRYPSPNLWTWSGPGGWKEGWLNSLITFGTLKGFGQLAQEQNILVQHGIQDLGMVWGHQVTSFAGLGEKPEGSFAEQFLHAEVTNLQIGAGMTLGHQLTAEKLLTLEKGLDLSMSGTKANIQPSNENFLGLQNKKILTVIGPDVIRPNIIPRIHLSENKGTDSDKSKIGEEKKNQNKSVFPIRLDFKLSEPIHEEIIHSIIKAIITQDFQLYPNGDPTPMATSEAYFKFRSYQIGNHNFTLNALAGRVRKARGFESSDTKKLKDRDIVQEWKEKIFQVKPTLGLSLNLDFKISEEPTQNEIEKIVQAIVAQDHDLYPNGDASPMSSRGVFRCRKYKIDGKSFTLNILAGWVRRLRDLNKSDKMTLSDSAIIQEWKENLFQIKPTLGFPIQLDFKISEEPTQNEIEKIVQAIVSQDHDLYPNGHAQKMSVNEDFFRRKYQINNRELNLGILLYWFKKLGTDKKRLKDSEIIRDWKNRLFGIQPIEKKPAIPINIDFEISDNPQEEEINKIVNAIISGDTELYPNGDISPMRTSPQYFTKRYQAGKRIVTLMTLASWLRKSRGHLKDPDLLKDGDVISYWKKNLFGMKIAKKIRETFPIQIDFEIANSPNENQIEKIVSAIVAQDHEIYSQGDGRLLGATEKNFSKRYYKVGKRTVSLSTLVYWVRQARNLKVMDTKILPNGQIVEEWREKIFGLTKATDAFPIHLSFQISKRPTEEEIGEILKAIVAQDNKLYPSDETRLLSGSNFYFHDRRYMIGEEIFTLEKLARMVRWARGFKYKDQQSLPNFTIIKEWNEKLFGIKPESRPLDLMLSENPSEVEIGLLVRTIVLQDSEFYPNGDASRMTTGPKYFRDAWYRVGGKEVNLDALARWLRECRGLEAGDKTSLSDLAIVEEWKRDLGFEEKPPPPTEEELKSYLEEIGLEELSLLGGSVRNLADFLELTHPAKANSKQIQGMVRAFTGLGLKTEIHKGPPTKALDDEDRIIRTLFLKRAKEKELSEDEWAQTLRLYLRLIQRSFTANFDLSLKFLGEKQSQAQDPQFQRLYTMALEHFYNLRTRAEKELVPLKTDTPFPYQKEGALFVIDHPKAMILDDPGLGKGLQAILAVETLYRQGKVRKVLVVCPATLKDYWRKEIGKNAPRNPNVLVIEGDTQTKKALVSQSAEADYIIANYEFLRNKSPEDLKEIFTGLDMLVIDEAQRVSNPSERIQQAAAIRKISTDRTLLLTATPYHSKPVWIYSLLKYLFPQRKEFDDFKAFHETYAKDPQGLYRLHQELNAISMRREKEEVFGRYQKDEAPNGYWKLPYLDVIPPAQEGQYTLSPEQIDFLAWISQDPKDWRRWYEENRNSEKTHKKITHFIHLQYLHAASLTPELVGGKGPSPLLKALDPIVEKRMREGKKVILYGWHREVIDQLVKRYREKYNSDGGVIQLNGETPIDQREDLVQKFQEDPKTRILVANMEVGGVGLTLTAADTLIFVEKPLSFSTYYQSLNRADRIDLGRKKQKVEIVSMVGIYPKGVAEKYENKNLKDFFTNDSIPEILEERLQGMEKVYRLVMDGRLTDEAVNIEVKKQLASRLKGVRFEEKLPERRREIKEKKRLRAVSAFGRLYDRLKEDPTTEAQLVMLAHLFSKTSLNPSPLAQVLEGIFFGNPEHFPWASELKWITTAFLIKNKYIRDQMIGLLPEVLRRIYPSRPLDSIVNAIRIENRPSLARAYLPALLALQLYEKPSLLPGIKGIFFEINDLRSSHERNTTLDQLIVILGHLTDLENPSFVEFFKRHESLLTDRLIPLSQRIRLLEQLGLMKKTQDPSLEGFFQKQFTSFDSMKSQLDQIYLNGILGRFHLENNPKIKEGLERVLQEWGNVDPLLAILGGLLKDSKRYQEEIQVFREAAYHIFRGDFSAWRKGELPLVYARGIDYLKAEKLFWDPWTTRDSTEIPRIEAGPQKRIYENIRIFDTDDPNWILRRGELSDQIKNCFQVHGNPERVRALITDLASKSRRLVVTLAGNRVVSVAIAKIGKGPGGSPLIHLEKPLYEKGGYPFEREMLAHLNQKKRLQMNPQPWLTKDMAGRSASNKTTVWSIGAATKDEHSEALFGFRPTERLSHPGEVIEGERSLEKNSPLPHLEKVGELSLPPLEKVGPGGISPIGIGTSNKPIGLYLQELKDQGVKVVVDVRGSPFSRFYPHFNKERLATALKAEGIEYFWFGDTLGNPKDAGGQRTLEGFQDYMKTEPYQRGLARLLEILQKAEGKIALTCAEGAEAACHRKFILADLYPRLPLK